MAAACNGDSSESTPAAIAPPSGNAGTGTPTVVPVGTDPHAQIAAVTIAAVTPGDVAGPGCSAPGAPRRLTRDQVVNALTDVTVALTGDSTLAASVGPLVRDTTQFPPDVAVNPDTSRHKGYERLDTGVNLRQVTALHDTAEALAKSMTSDANRLNTMLGSCTGTSDACVTSFIRKAAIVVLTMAGVALLVLAMTVAPGLSYFAVLAGSLVAMSFLGAREVQQEADKPQFDIR
jgi:hypothetical protein